MKIGHFTAIILFCLTIFFGGLFYLDIQDEIFSSKLLFTPIFFTYLIVVFLIFPGSKISENTEINYLENLSLSNIKKILIGFALILYVYFWVESLFTGENFFAIGNQVSLFLSFTIIFLFIKWRLESLKKRQ